MKRPKERIYLNKKQQNLIKVLKAFFSKEKGVLFCYLFGSVGYRNTTRESDLDLAMYLDENKCGDLFEKRLELISRLSRLTKMDADVIILNSTSPFLRYVVLKEGILVFERDRDKRIEAELKYMNEYFDFQPTLKTYHQRILTS